MRPVHRGTAPKAYARYQDAALDLHGRLGGYCSYCERQIETHLAVEHIQPKSRVGSLRNVWNNFLLACVNCNSCKGRTRVKLAKYFWPDTDNTLRAFEYVNAGLVRPRPTLTQSLRVKAQATLKLAGLDRVPGHRQPAKRPSKTDRRWLRRVEAWQLAQTAKKCLDSHDSHEVRELIVQTALGRGMFSIWWTVFAGEVDMRRRLRLAFLGTDIGSFDANEDLQPRPGGQL